MKIVTLYLYTALSLALCLTLATSAMASPNTARTIGNSNHQQPLVVTSSKQAARLVQAHFGGKVLKVQASKKGQLGYKVKLIKANGNVISVWVDAKTGRLAKR